MIIFKYFVITAITTTVIAYSASGQPADTLGQEAPPPRGHADHLRMQIEPHNLEVSLHEPVVLKLTLNNLGPDAAVVDLGVNDLGAFRLSVRAPDGQIRALPPLRGSGTIGRITIATSASFSMPLILDEWISFAAPGSYGVEIRLPEIARSETITITALPRDTGRLKGVCAELARSALEAPLQRDAYVFARALSFVVDDEAVPYLKKMVENEDLAGTAVKGLERIADHNAVGALKDLYANPNKDVSAKARGALGMIRVQTKDGSLKQEIDAILAGMPR